jgi:hypothetical protein
LLGEPQRLIGRVGTNLFYLKIHEFEGHGRDFLRKAMTFKMDYIKSRMGEAVQVQVARGFR